MAVSRDVIIQNPSTLVHPHCCCNEFYFVFRAKLEAGESHTYRFCVPKGKTVVIDDIVRGRVVWDAESVVGDFILLRSTG